MDDLPSGLYKYAGNSSYSRFRVVLTDPVMVSENWNNRDSQSKSRRLDDKYPIEKHTSIGTRHPDHSSVNVKHQASFLLTKRLDTGEWSVNEEDTGKFTCKSMNSSTATRSSSLGCEVDSKDESDCLATILRNDGFALSVKSVPPNSRIKCHDCDGKLFKGGGGFNHKAGIDMFDDGKQKSEPTARDRKFASSRSRIRGTETDCGFRKLRQNDVFDDFSSLLVERRRASFWKDSLDMTSVSTSNSYWRSMDARKLLVEHDDFTQSHRHQKTTARAHDTISLLMRNHYFPQCERCQCSRIQSTSTDKTFDFGVICVPCLTDNGSASDNNEDGNNLDRRRDNIDIPISERLLCRCRAANFGPRYKDRLGRCDELRGDYKRCQKLMNRLIDGGKTPTMADPLECNPISSLGLCGQKSDNIQTKALNRKLASLVELNEIDNSCDERNSCDDLDLTQETNECGLNNGPDFLSRVMKALGNHESIGYDENDSPKDGNHIAEKLRTLEMSEDAPKEMSKCVCRCDQSHRETLVILLDRYNTGLPRTKLNEKTAASNGMSKGTSRENFRGGVESSRHDHSVEESNVNHESIAKEYPPLHPDEQVDQSRDQWKEISSGNDQSPISMEKPAVVLDSAVTISSNTTLTDSIRVNSNKKIQARQADQFKQRHSLNNGAKPDGSAHISNITAHNSDAEARLEAPLSAQELHKLVDNKDNNSAQYNAQRNYSIALAVIVIDVLNGTVQVKPDLNELILIDMRALKARNDEVVNSIVLEANPQIEMRSSRINHILYHVEFSEKLDDIEASDQDLNRLRNAFGMVQLEIPQSKFEPFRERIKDTVVSLHKKPVLGLFQKDILIKLQFDIHYATEFPRDFKNIYIRYKIYLMKNESWHIKKHIETPHFQITNNDTHTGPSPLFSKKFKHIERASDRNGDKTKLEHMTHNDREICPLDDSGIGQNNLITSSIGTVSSNKWQILDGNRREIDRTSAMTSYGDNGFDSDTCNDIEEGDGKYSLLLEGSTVTSRPNSHGYFNFCCVEQLLLRLSRKTKKPSKENGRNSSTTKIKRGDAISSSEEMKRPEEIPAEIDEQKSFKSSDRNQIQTPGGVVHSPTTDRLISESAEYSTSADSEQTPTVTIIKEDLPPKNGVNYETGNIFSSNVLDMRQSRDDPKARGESCRLNDRPNDLARNEEPSKGFRFEVNVLQDSGQRNNLSDICQIVMVFEIYSSDFYSDKLRGWSSMRVPISLDKEDCNIRDEFLRKTSTLSSNDKSIRQFDECFKCTCTNHKAQHHQLPVMRPTLSAPMDRLRYYLMGEIPKKTPTIANLIKSDCRYMAHTQHCGNLIVGLDVLRQHE